MCVCKTAESVCTHPWQAMSPFGVDDADKLSQSKSFVKIYLKREGWIYINVSYYLKDASNVSLRCIEV